MIGYEHEAEEKTLTDLLVRGFACIKCEENQSCTFLSMREYVHEPERKALMDLLVRDFKMRGKSFAYIFTYDGVRS